MTRKEKQKKYAADYYLANIDKMKGRAKKGNKQAIQRNKEYVRNYLSTHPCTDCGEGNIIVLEFDHVRGIKIESVSVLAREACSLVRLQEEIDKCEVRCANCHRIVTYNRRNNVHSDVTQWLEYLSDT